MGPGHKPRTTKGKRPAARDPKAEPRVGARVFYRPETDAPRRTRDHLDVASVPRPAQPMGMSMFCVLGWHSWQARGTARPGTTVYRCRHCDKRLVMHGGRSRQLRRYYLIWGAMVCMVAWFAIINLGLHGRTKVLYTANKAVGKMEKARIEASRTIHRVQGDSGAYLNGDK